MAGLTTGSGPTDGSLRRPPSNSSDIKPRSLLGGRYTLFGEIASGGMATVHFGRLRGPAGFSRTVAIKRLHPQLAKEPELASMFLDEVRVAARIHHPNVVATLDTVEDNGELFLVMEYVNGESLAQLLRLARTRGAFMPPMIASTVVCGMLHGLHAAHEAIGENGEPLHIIHRDVSPQNVIVGTDGVSRVLDFGIARAVGRLQTTREGQLKGKIAYLAPERVHARDADRRSDVYGAAVVLWEALTGVQLFEGDSDVAVLAQVVSKRVEPPSSIAPALSEALDAITVRGLDRDPDRRFSTAREMALALQQEVGVVTASEVGDWVTWIAADRLAHRARALAAMEAHGRAESGPAQPSDARDTAPTRVRVDPSTRVLPVQLPPPADTTPMGHAEAAEETDAASEPSTQTDGLEPPPSRRAARLAMFIMAPVVLTAALAAVWRQSQPTRTPAPATGGSMLTGAPAPPPATATAPEEPAQPSAGSAERTVGTPSTATTALTVSPTAPATRTLPRERGRAKPSNSHSLATQKGIASSGAAEPTRPAVLADPDPSAVAPPPPVVRNSCRPPYTVDSTGAKHFKIDCIVDGRQ